MRLHLPGHHRQPLIGKAPFQLGHFPLIGKVAEHGGQDHAYHIDQQTEAEQRTAVDRLTVKVKLMGDHLRGDAENKDDNAEDCHQKGGRSVAPISPRHLP